MLHGNTAGTFDDENPYENMDVSFTHILSGEYMFIVDLVKTLKSLTHSHPTTIQSRHGDPRRQILWKIRQSIRQR